MYDYLPDESIVFVIPSGVEGYEFCNHWTSSLDSARDDKHIIISKL